MKLMGLRHDIIAKDDIYYVLFYDIDGHAVSESFLLDIDRLMLAHRISYMVIKTKNGYHIIGLTPLTVTQWCSIFVQLKHMFNSYYGGIVIRLSRKPDEIQELVKLEESYGEVIPNLFNLYSTRFGLQKKPWRKEFAKYLLVFERYRTEKE